MNISSVDRGEATKENHTKVFFPPLFQCPDGALNQLRTMPKGTNVQKSLMLLIFSILAWLVSGMPMLSLTCQEESSAFRMRGFVYCTPVVRRRQ
ncbi:hypothetical protein GJAV_G00219650 [Gymnothorax javanicus]|nr:hypothetical protein GJAV_G00219650 [Gymnothorax javanicus]